MNAEETREALTKVLKDKKYLEEANLQLEDFGNSEDSIIAIITTASLDNSMFEILSNLFIKGNVSNNMLHSSKGRLGDYQSKADLLYCLNMIDKKLYQDINRIGNIRNIIAHSTSKKKFSDPEIFNLIKEFNTAQYENGTKSEQARDLYIFIFGTIKASLKMLSVLEWHCTKQI